MVLAGQLCVTAQSQLEGWPAALLLLRTDASPVAPGCPCPSPAEASFQRGHESSPGPCFHGEACLTPMALSPRRNEALWLRVPLSLSVTSHVVPASLFANTLLHAFLTPTAF